MTLDLDLDPMIRSLDAAGPERADPGTLSPRARADLARIVATDRHARVDTRRRGRRVVRTVLAASSVVAAAAAAVVVLPAWTGGDRAFATWTADPTALTRQQAHDAAGQCRKAQADGPGSGYEQQLASAVPAVAERRGAWTTVVLAGADGFAATCITDESTHLFRDWFGSVGVPTGYTSPGGGDVVATDLGVGAIGAGELSVVAGSVGADVTAITYDSRSEGAVRATVARGRFALWVPGDELEGAGHDGVELRVTHRDGTSGLVRVSL